MKGDFSSLAFSGSQPYSRVLTQQGRVQLDADWNTQAALFARAQRDLARAMFGREGAPAADPGFAIRVRHGLRFGPRDFVHIGRAGSPPPLSFNAHTRFTLEAWVVAQPGGGGLLSNLNVPSTPSGSAASPRQNGAPTQPGGGYALSLTADGRLRFECMRGATVRAPDAGIFTLESVRALPFGQLCHVSASCDGEHVSLYLDATLVAEERLPEGCPAAPYALLLGARIRDRQPAEGLHGTLYMVAIWAEACGAARLHEWRHQHRHHPQQHLMGAWYFDETDATLVRDASGNGHDGHLGRPGSAESRPSRTGPELWIGSGQFYLEGLLCENLSSLPLQGQPSLPGAAPLPGAGSHLVYLDVWERYLSSVEAPDIAEPALGGADTTGRVSTVSQVRIGSRAELTRRRLHAHGQLRLRPHLRDGADPHDNLLYRVELHHPGALQGSVRDKERSWRIAGCNRIHGLLELKHWSAEAAQWQPGQPLELFRDGDGSDSVVVTVQESNPDARTLRVGPLAQDVGGWRLRPLATFKWSRDNASHAYPVHRVAGLEVYLDHHGPAQAPLALNDWVELSDDALVLNGLPGCLCRIASIDIDAEGRSQIGLTPPAGVTELPQPGRHALLRRWDAPADANQIAALAPDSGGHTLDDDLSIAFDGFGDGRSGDYWTFTLRDGQAQVGWPERDGQGEWMAPHGIVHHYGELAWLHIDDSGIRVEDLRPVLGALGDFVARGGDTMTGPLNVHAPLHVSGGAVFDGDVQVGALYGALGPDMVGNEQLRQHAVTRSKLAPGLGLVPPGFAILGTSSTAPPGYHYSGAHVLAQRPATSWQPLIGPPGDPAFAARGRCHTATWNERLLAIFERSGEVWEYGSHGTSEEHWRPGPAMPQPHRHAFAIAVADGGLHVIGGCEADGTHSGRNERLDLQHGQWQERAALPQARSHLAAAALDGRIHVVGGQQQGWPEWLAGGATHRHDIYDPSSDSWRHAQRFPHASSRLALCANNGKLHAMGGLRVGPFALGGARATRGHFAYHAHGDHWVRLPPLAHPNCDGAAVQADGNIYLAGGHGRHEVTNEVHAFGAADGRWHEHGAMLGRRAGFGLSYRGSGLYAIGGGVGEGPAAEYCVLAHVLHVHLKSHD